MKSFFEKNTLVSILFLSILLAPFILVTKYNLPSYDDYAVPEIINKMGYFKTQWHWYLNWTGRYSADFIIGLIHPMIYSKSGIALYGFFSAIILIGFVIALYKFLASLLPSASLGNKLSALTGLLFIYLFEMPSPTEGFYWMVGAWTYTFGVIIALQLGTELINYTKKTSKLRLFYLILLAVLLPGTSEVIDLIFLSSYCLVLSLVCVQRREIERINFLILGILAVFTLISFLAPGNAARALSVVEAGAASKDPSIVLPETFKYAIKHIVQWVVLGPFMIIAFLSISYIPNLKNDLLKLVNNWVKFGYWIIASNLFVIIFIFPVLWSSGIAPDRIYNPIALYYIIVTLLSFMFLFNLLRINRFELPMPAALIISAFLFGYTLSSQNRISRIWIEVRTGEAKAYYAEMQEIYAMCKSNPGEKIVIRPMKNRPNTIFINDLHINQNHWENQFFSKFHGIESARTGDSTLTYIETINEKFSH
jgi:hypothetical protein